MNLVLEVAREKKKQYIFLTPQDLRYDEQRLNSRSFACFFFGLVF